MNGEKILPVALALLTLGGLALVWKRRALAPSPAPGPAMCGLTREERQTVANALASTESELRGTTFTRQEIVSRLRQLSDYALERGCLVEAGELERKADRIERADPDANVGLLTWEAYR